MFLCSFLGGLFLFVLMGASAEVMVARTDECTTIN